MHPHEILACIELAFYIGLLVPVSFCTFYYLLKGQFAWLYLQLFVIAKIAGPALLIHIVQNPSASTGLQIATQILYQIALGPLMSATFSFVIASPRAGSDKTQPSYSPLTHAGRQKALSAILLLAHPVIATGLALGIVGGIDLAPDSSTGTVNPDKYDKGVTFSKASVALFVLGFAPITAGALDLWKHRKALITHSYYVVTGMPVVLPVLLIRILYSILNAANLGSSHA
ncbi:hypothetical protein N7488_004719 [Penicillium malachiteum]|nr:hypothetical protein N7488_004719 [Penicillium malachiteum]